MWIIAAFGGLVVAISLVMVMQAESFSRLVISFSEHSFFHYVEIASRATFGIALILVSEQARYATFISVTGYLLVAVAGLLVVIRPSWHRQFAQWAASRFRHWFRPAGCAGSLLGLLYLLSAVPIAR